MSLAARVCGFFLATLAVVLAGVSATLYLLSSAHLHRDLDERLGLALDTLTTSVDVDPGRVEWNVGARRGSWWWSRTTTRCSGWWPTTWERRWIERGTRRPAICRPWRKLLRLQAILTKRTPMLEEGAGGRHCGACTRGQLPAG